MKYYLQLSPYHYNITAYWRENSNQHLDEDFRSWLDKEWRATIGSTIADTGGRWQFENEQDATLFALRWA